MTDTKQELLALIDRLDPERQAILLQYARGLEQAGPLLEKWVEEFKIAEKRIQWDPRLDVSDTYATLILDYLNGPTEEFPLFLSMEIQTCLSAIRGYMEILLEEPKLASLDLTLVSQLPKGLDTSEFTVSHFLKKISDNIEYVYHVTHLAPIYARYRIRRLQERDESDS